ncbi:MAG: virulence RhuM family protein [Hydrogenophilus sp.]|nr:virulence RhuM family protein [Hydrogenophilus sp.]
MVIVVAERRLKVRIKEINAVTDIEVELLEFKRGRRIYNFDVIISVGYRVKSQQGTRFRQWATRVGREHLTRGFSLDRQRFEYNAAGLQAKL